MDEIYIGWFAVLVSVATLIMVICNTRDIANHRAHIARIIRNDAFLRKQLKEVLGVQQGILDVVKTKPIISYTTLVKEEDEEKPVMSLERGFADIPEDKLKSFD